jgi:hypothetical protein
VNELTDQGVAAFVIPRAVLKDARLLKDVFTSKKAHCPECLRLGELCRQRESLQLGEYCKNQEYGCCCIHITEWLTNHPANRVR